MDVGTFRIILIWVPGIQTLAATGNPYFIFLEIVTATLILNDKRGGKIRVPVVVTSCSDSTMFYS